MQLKIQKHTCTCTVCGLSHYHPYCVMRKERRTSSLVATVWVRMREPVESPNKYTHTQVHTIIHTNTQSLPSISFLSSNWLKFKLVLTNIEIQEHKHGLYTQASNTDKQAVEWLLWHIKMRTHIHTQIHMCTSTGRAPLNGGWCCSSPNYIDMCKIHRTDTNTCVLPLVCTHTKTHTT